MKKTIFAVSLLMAMFFLSGCSLGTNVSQPTAASQMPKATFIKTSDGGAVWEPRMKVDEKKTIASLNVLTLVTDPFDPTIVYLGTEKNGIFVSRDGAETWSQIKFPEKVYGLALDHSTRGIIYASGVLKGRSKIFKRTGEESEWREIYTEPADGTVISALAMDKNNASVLYAGTNEGVIFKTVDGGNTWNHIHKAEGPVTSIAFDSSSTSTVYFGIHQRALLKTSDRGGRIENITSRLSAVNGNQSVFSVSADPRLGGILYVGLGNGIVKSVNGGETWTSLNILGSSRSFPIRVLAINPQNSNELIYVAGKAMYKSVDGGTQWATFQLDTGKDVSGIVYNKNNPAIIYAGLRNF